MHAHFPPPWDGLNKPYMTCVEKTEMKQPLVSMIINTAVSAVQDRLVTGVTQPRMVIIWSQKHRKINWKWHIERHNSTGEFSNGPRTQTSITVKKMIWLKDWIGAGRQFGLSVLWRNSSWLVYLCCISLLAFSLKYYLWFSVIPFLGRYHQLIV